MYHSKNILNNQINRVCRDNIELTTERSFEIVSGRCVITRIFYMNGNLSVWERRAQGWGPSGGVAHSWWLHHTQTNTHTHPRPSWHTHAHTRRLYRTWTTRRRQLDLITWFNINLFFPQKISNSSECHTRGRLDMVIILEHWRPPWLSAADQ